MFARVYMHYVAEGMESKGTEKLRRFASEVEASGGAKAVYVLKSQALPVNLTTVVVWESREAWQKFERGRPRPLAGVFPEPAQLWARVEGADFDVLYELPGSG